MVHVGLHSKEKNDNALLEPRHSHRRDKDGRARMANPQAGYDPYQEYSDTSSKCAKKFNASRLEIISLHSSRMYAVVGTRSSIPPQYSPAQHDPCSAIYFATVRRSCSLCIPVIVAASKAVGIGTGQRSNTTSRLRDHSTNCHLHQRKRHKKSQHAATKNVPEGSVTPYIGMIKRLLIFT